MNKQDRLLALQYMLYEKIRSRIYGITGPDSESLLEYEFSFLNALPKNSTPCDARVLIASLDQTSVVLCGDFHSLASNQENFLKLVMYSCERTVEPPVIALECFTERDQRAVDAFLAEQMTEAELLNKTQYFESWGFPWGPIKKILQFAKESNCPVRCLNPGLSKGHMSTLSERDIVFAKHISSLIASKPQQKVFALIGEHHLSRNHLPADLCRLGAGHLKQEDITCLFFNTDKYYFKCLEAFSHFPQSFLLLGKNDFCLLDTPPWGKWLSFLLWQEHLIAQPYCDHLPDADDSDADEQCVYDTDEYFNDCFNGFLQFFGKEYPYPPLCNMYSSLLSVDEHFFAARNRLNTWTFLKFKHYDAALDRSSKMIYCKALCWRGLIHAMAQCMSCYSQEHSAVTEKIDRVFFDNLKLSVLCHSFESIFNPVGYMASNWILEHMPFHDEVETKLSPNGILKIGDGLPPFSTGDFFRSLEVGKLIALVCAVQSASQPHNFEYLHRFMLKNEIAGTALVTKLLAHLNQS